MSDTSVLIECDGCTDSSYRTPLTPTGKPSSKGIPPDWVQTGRSLKRSGKLGVWCPVCQQADPHNLSSVIPSRETPLLAYMNAEKTPVRDVAYLRLYAAKVRDKSEFLWEIPTTRARVLEDIATRSEQQQAERETLIAALRRVHDTFAKDEAQGYRSRDREFAITVLGAALASVGGET